MKALLLNNKVLKASIVMSSLVPALAYADDPACSGNPNDPSTDPISAGAACSKSSSNVSSLFANGGAFHVIANTLIYIVGAVAVIMLIVGGLRYVISQGSKEGVQAGKDTILYSVIGIIVAILAYAIVNFVTGALTPSTANGQ